jgi:hypothetical protein
MLLNASILVMKQQIPLTPHFRELVNKVSIPHMEEVKKLLKAHPRQSLLNQKTLP